MAITSTPMTAGAIIAVSTSINLASLSVDGMTIGTLVWNEETSSYFALTISTATLTSSVVAATGVSGVRWIEQNIATTANFHGVLPIANGGTGQSTANSALNALQVIASGQRDVILFSGIYTASAPDLVVEQVKSPGITAVGFGGLNAIELQNASGTLKRVMTDTTAFLISAAAGAEDVSRTFQIMTGGVLSPHSIMKYVGGSANNPAMYFGNPASAVGILRATNNLQFSVGSAIMDCSGSLITSLVRHAFSARLLQGVGAAVASATTLTLGNDGNIFPISGTTTINGITTANWTGNPIVYLKFAGILTVTNNSGAPGGGAVAIKTTTGANVTTAANSVMTLMYDGTFWVQVCPITPGY